MNNNITLNASMRSNLLSLRNISKQMDKTQLILATGKKVNSAIDNASAYYQARSLTNRAADLTALLDAMGQGIQTIEAANAGLDKADDLLNLAQSTANSALENLKIPEKSYFESLVGNDGAVVTNAQELLAAVNAGKETICVYGKIDIEEQVVYLKANQKLVGIGYYGKFDSDTNKFSALNFDYTRNVGRSFVNVLNGSNVISDLEINVQSAGLADCNAIYVNNTKDILIKNISINANANGVRIVASENIRLEGSNYFNLVGDDTITAIVSNNSSADIYGETTIKNIGDKYNYGLNGNINIYGKLNIYSEGSFSFPVTTNTGKITFKSTSEVNMMGYNNMCILQASTTPGIMTFEVGARLNYQNQGSFVAEKDVTVTGNTGSGGHIFITAAYLRKNLTDFKETAYSWKEVDFEGDKYGIKGKVEEDYTEQFNKIFMQYDKLLKDSTYQGINLLLNGQLKIDYNENRTSSFLVKGFDISSKSIGMEKVSWLVAEDVQKTLDQILNAKVCIRNTSAQLGNYYSIIQTRINFTEALTDVLETGADNLTLADMNEASAEYLTLQTRQQLAINSLSLASQSAQGILSIF